MSRQSREFSIKLPYRNGAASIDQVLADCRYITDSEDREIAAEFISSAAAIAGVETAQELRWLAEDLEPAGRRTVLDKLRSRLGKKSIEEVERREQIRQRFVAASHPRPTTWDPLTFASSDPADETHDANTARTRALERQVRAEEAAADAERHIPTQIDAANLPQFE